MSALEITPGCNGITLCRICAEITQIDRETGRMDQRRNHAIVIAGRGEHRRGVVAVGLASSDCRSSWWAPSCTPGYDPLAKELYRKLSDGFEEHISYCRPTRVPDLSYDASAVTGSNPHRDAI